MDRTEQGGLEATYMTVGDAARYFGVTPAAVYGYVNAGHLEFVRFGKRILLKKVGVLAMAGSRAAKAGKV